MDGNAAADNHRFSDLLIGAHQSFISSLCPGYIDDGSANVLTFHNIKKN
jgi:hypothetical protein